MPVFEYCSVCVGPTAVPSTYMRASHSFGFAVFSKYIVPVCVAPSESNNVSDVAWLKVLGLAGSNGTRRGGTAYAGRCSRYSAVDGAAARRPVARRLRSLSPPAHEPRPLLTGR